MRDIKTRESRAGSVKTIDRASMLGDRMKQASIKGKEQIRGFDQSDRQNETAYAEEKTFDLAEDTVSGAGNVAGYGMKQGRKVANLASEDEKVANLASEDEKIANLTNPKGKVANLASSTYQSGESWRRMRASASASQGIPREKTEAALKKQYQVNKAKDNVRRKTEKGGKRVLSSLRRVIQGSKFIAGCFAVEEA